MQHKSPISLNVPDSLRDAIDEAARAKLLSRSAWIRTTLADHVAEQRQSLLQPAAEPTETEN